MSSNPVFHYPPLPSTDGLRILTLEPAGEFWDPLSGTLESVPFSSRPRYLALSYTWADPDEEHAKTSADSLNERTISLGGQPLQLFHNASLALRFLRSLTHPLTLWVDAICIDQSSIPERNAQVALMAFIFTRAAGVVSWLGGPVKAPIVHPQDHKEDMTSEWKIGTGQLIASRFAELIASSSGGGQGPNLFSFADPQPQKPPSVDYETRPGSNERDFPTFHAVASGQWLPRVSGNPYWDRLWVVQEVCLPRNLAFLVGGELWPEKAVLAMMASAREWSKKIDPVPPTPVAMDRLLTARRERFSDAMRLEALVERFMGSGCAETRDRVFALVGLANDIDSFALGIPEPEPTEQASGGMRRGRDGSPRRTRLEPLRLRRRDDSRERGSYKVDYESYTPSGVPVTTYLNNAISGLSLFRGSASQDTGTQDGQRLITSDLTKNKERRGRGLLEIDYTQSFYKIWCDVVAYMHFRAKPLRDFGSEDKEMEDERGVRVVRFAGVLQKAFEGKVEAELKERLKIAEEVKTNPVDPGILRVRAKGYVAGTILHLGPPYSDFLSSYREQQRWIGSWDTYYHEASELETMRQMEEVYSAKILDYTDADLSRIRCISGDESIAWLAGTKEPALSWWSGARWKEASGTHADPVRFLGTDFCVGLAPPGVRTGDQVVRFWNCDAAIIVRATTYADTGSRDAEATRTCFELVGRADVAEPYDRAADGSDNRAREAMQKPVKAPMADSARSSALPAKSTRIALTPTVASVAPQQTESNLKAMYVRMDFEILQKITAAIAI